MVLVSPTTTILFESAVSLMARMYESVYTGKSGSEAGPREAGKK